jgi:hypothetical protein
MCIAASLRAAQHWRPRFLASNRIPANPLGPPDEKRSAASDVNYDLDEARMSDASNNEDGRPRPKLEDGAAKD